MSASIDIPRSSTIASFGRSRWSDAVPVSQKSASAKHDDITFRETFPNFHIAVADQIRGNAVGFDPIASHGLNDRSVRPEQQYRQWNRCTATLA